jgi:HEAT repeat protein
MLSSSLFRTSCGLVTALALFGAGCASSSAPTGAPSAPSSPVAPTVSNEPTTPLVLDRSVAAVGTNRTAVRAKIAELLAELRQPGASQQTRQNICEQLGRILGPLSADDPALAVLAPMLGNADEVNMARLALEPVPGAAVDAAFVTALGRATGATRLALIQSLGTRRQTGAVPALAALLKDTDTAHAAAAAHALGQIGTAEALLALVAAPNPAAPAVVEARISAAWQLPELAGNAALRAVLDDARIAPPQRAAALRGLLAREPASATPRFIEHLSGDDPVFKSVVIEAIAAHPAPGLAAALAGRLASWDAATQEAVIAALGNKGDAAALPAIAAALGHETAGVRLAALAALPSFTATPELAARVAAVAARASGDEAALALRSLSRLKGPGVSEAIATQATQGESALRSVYLEAIGLRNQTESLPLLFAARRETDVNVRSAALASLNDLAPADSQAELLAWAIDAADGREATRALRAFTSVSLRNTDLATRDRALVGAIDRAAPAVQLRLLTLLPRLPSALTRESAARLALGADERVAGAMLAQLQRWPDATVLPVYVSIAERTQSDSIRKTAIDGALRLLEQGRSVPAAEQSATVAVLFGTTKDAALRRTLVGVLGRGASPFAQTFVGSLQGEPELAEAVRHALAAISANQKWPPVVTTSNGAQAANLVDGRTNTPWRVSLVGEQWLQADLKDSRPLRRLTLDHTGRPGDYPTEYAVFVTDDPASWGAAVATGSGQRDRTAIDLPAGTKGRYVRITNAEQRENASWTVSELFID